MTTTIHTSTNGHSSDGVPQTASDDSRLTVNGHLQAEQPQAEQPQAALEVDDLECSGIICLPSLLDLDLPLLARKVGRIFQWGRKVRDVVGEYVSGAVSLR